MCSTCVRLVLYSAIIVEPGTVAHTYKHSMQEAETEKLSKLGARLDNIVISGQLGYNIEPVSKQEKKSLTVIYKAIKLRRKVVTVSLHTEKVFDKIQYPS